MNLPKLLALSLCTPMISLAADPTPALKDPVEQKAWAAIAARFASAPSVKADNTKTTEIAVTGLKNDPKGANATASITVDKASGHVVQVTSNGAGISDAEMAAFAAFPDLQNITLWHNSGNGFTGTGLAGVAKLPKLERVTLAGGSFDDAGMAEAAKMPKLKELRAWHSKFTDAGVATFRNHPALESITIGPMWEKALTDKTLEALATCPKLKKLGISETWLTWEGGLKHLVKLKGTLTDLDFGNCIIEPAELERLRTEMPGTKIAWKGLGAGKEELSKAWIRPKAEKWIPKELLDRVMAGESK
jgi:hypothetical protein